MPTVILPCGCKNEYQDEKYGKGLRVHNRAKNKGSGTFSNARCTVCEKVKENVKDQ